MRASTAIIVGCAALAIASPMLAKRAEVTETVYKTVYTTVTWSDPGPIIPATPGAVNNVNTRHRHKSVTPGVAPPAATSSAAPVVVVPTTPAVVIVTTPAPAAPAKPTTTAAAAASIAPALNLNAGTSPTTDYKSTCLYHHNVHRANHSSPALVYDDQLAAYALVVANSCIFAHNLTPGGGGYGQNIADQGTTDPKENQKDPKTQAAAVISDFWYNGELYQYPWADVGKPNPSFNDFDAWGHMSQVVWKDTLRVGCATVYCAAGAGGAAGIFKAPFSGFFTVCNYSPPGNMGGEYGANVFAPEGHPTVAI